MKGASRTELEDTSRGMARALDEFLKDRFGRRMGFSLFVFEFGEKTNLSYMSNGSREDMIAVVKEWLARVESGLTTDPPGPKAEG